MTPALYIVSALISMLVGGNMFFIKKLVDKVDDADRLSLEARTQITLLQKDIDLLQSRIHELTISIREITDLKFKLAVLEIKVAALEGKRPTN